MTKATLHQDYISFEFEQSFEQEDIAQLNAKLVTHFPQAQVLETYLGADRVSYRMQVHEQYWVIHYEVYSQSCWLESEYETTEVELKSLYFSIKSNFS